MARRARQPPWLRIAIAAGALAAAAPPARALHPATRLYLPHDGLPQQRITAVSQDARGFLWIGTQRGGLARYDGRSWLVLDTADGLPSNDVRWLSRAPDGTVYVATAGGFGRLAGTRFEELAPERESADRMVRVLEASTAGRVWVGRRTGLFVWSRAEGLRPVGLAGPDGRQPDVEGLAPDGAGGVFVACDRGLAHVGPPPASPVDWVGGLPAGSPDVVVRRRDGTLAVAVDRVGLFVGVPGSFRRLGDEAQRRVLSVFDEGDALLVGTSGAGAYRCRATCTPLLGEDLGPEGMVFDIFRDREGVLWFATDEGLGKRVPSAFRTFDAADGFPASEWLYGMAETPDGAVWVAASGVRAVRIGADGRARAFEAGLPNTLLTHVLTDRRGRLLACTRRGLFRLAGERFVPEPLPAAVPTDLNTALDTPEGLYVATWNEGLYLVRDGAARLVEPPVGRIVEALALLRDGRVACGGAGFGVAVLDRGRVAARFTARDGLPSDSVNGILEDSRGALWVATESGAWARRPDGTTLRLDRAAGLPGNFVHWIAETPDGATWLGTNHGVARRSVTGRLERFTTRDGLARNECSPASVFVDSRGRLFVGTSALSVFEARPAPPGVAPPVYVEAGSGGDARAAAGVVRVRAGQGVLHLRFASPSFVDEQATRFRTRLIGLSEGWREGVPGQAETTYAALPAGDYQFEVTAAASDGRVSWPARLDVVVEPRWWERTPFRAGLAGLGAFLLATAVRLRERAHRRAEARLQALVGERTAALHAANDQLTTLAATDELTGVANRRRVMEDLRQAIAVARRQRLPLAVALVDLDGFKAVNDTHGHPAGDDCLRWVARELRAALRETDRLGRLGGDEFMAVLLATDVEGAGRVASRMASGIVARPWRLADGRRAEPTVTLSIGLSALREGDAGPEELLHRADRALYAAKHGGKARAAVVE